MLLKGIETLPLRVEAMSRGAAEIAAFLARHPKVERTLYPGLESHPQYALARRQMSGGGTLVALSVRGGKAAAFRFQNALRLIEISNNLGDGKSLITHPATTTHRRFKPEERAALGIDDGLVRLSVGLEDPADLVADLEQALAVCSIPSPLVREGGPQRERWEGEGSAAEEYAMRKSDKRILTTHTGSLPRPAALTRLYARRARGESVDEGALAAAGMDALRAVVPKQIAAGIDCRQ